MILKEIAELFLSKVFFGSWWLGTAVRFAQKHPWFLGRFPHHDETAPCVSVNEFGFVKLVLAPVNG